jgi:hypothetical protein
MPHAIDIPSETLIIDKLVRAYSMYRFCSGVIRTSVQSLTRKQSLNFNLLSLHEQKYSLTLQVTNQTFSVIEHGGTATK